MGAVRLAVRNPQRERHQLLEGQAVRQPAQLLRIRLRLVGTRVPEPAAQVTMFAELPPEQRAVQWQGWHSRHSTTCPNGHMDHRCY